MQSDTQTNCPEPILAELIALAENDEPAALVRIATLSEAHPADPRLHFLAGSLLAALGRIGEARAAMARSIEIAPDFAIARFQLGLLELSSGDGASADSILRPLDESGSDDALALFARGLRHLVRDDLAAAAELLRRGMETNRDHPLVSRDMALIVAEIEQRAAAAGPPAEEVSAAQMLLDQHRSRH